MAAAAAGIPVRGGGDAAAVASGAAQGWGQKMGEDWGEGVYVNMRGGGTRETRQARQTSGRRQPGRRNVRRTFGGIQSHPVP